MSTGTSSARKLAWAQVDVFAERPLEGNMLAIFTDATGLTDSEMQSLARETNLSETTFILPGDPDQEREHGVRVRIFTVEEELPFAGHPTLGTASWLWANHPVLRGANEIRLRLNAGTIPVRFPTQTGEYGVDGEMRQRDPEFGATPDRHALAHACGLGHADLHAALHPQVVSTGLPFCIVPLATLDALSRLRVDQSLLSALLQGTGAKFVYALVQTPHGTWRARMPFYGNDDPATGSAAGCAISYLVRHLAVPSGQSTAIHQGIEVFRPSRLIARAFWKGDSISDVFVAGRTIPVATGLFTLL